jgi:hypothetical protein
VEEIVYRTRIVALTAALSAAGIGMLIPAADAEGIPAFARQYGVSCSACHNPAPRLNGLGETFAANGFRFSPDEAPRDSIDTGDEQLLLLRSVPLAVRVDAYARADTRSGTPGTDLQTPWGIKLLSGGQIARRVSYYMYFFLTERGEVAGLEDAYIQLSDIAGVDLLAGQFQISDPLFKRELRLSYEDYQAYRVRVGDVRADLTYDRGLMALASPWDGADLSVQLVNGRGLDHATEHRIYDTDHWKNVALHLAQELGPAHVGAFGYFGTESADGVRSRMRVFGPELSLALGPFDVSAQLLRRLDQAPFFGDVGAPIDTRVDMGFAEVVWSPQGPTGQWFLTGLYNHISADAPVVSIRQGEPGLLRDYRSGAVGANYMAARNLRFTGELLYDFERRDIRTIVGLVTAF